MLILYLSRNQNPYVGVLAEFESRFNLLLDPLLVAVRFYEMAHTSWTSTTSTTPDSSDVDTTTAASGDHTYIVSTSSPQPQKNLKVKIYAFHHTYIHTHACMVFVILCIQTYKYTCLHTYITTYRNCS